MGDNQEHCVNKYYLQLKVEKMLEVGVASYGDYQAKHRYDY